MSGMTSMLRQRRKDINVKPNRRLDRKSSRGMLYENEELRLRTININAEVERGQTDIKKLKRENDQLKREILALRYEYDKLDQMLRERKSSPEHSDDSASVCSACPECSVGDAGSVRAHPQVAFDLSVVPEEEAQDIRSGADGPCTCEECSINDEDNSIIPNSEIEAVINVKPTTRTIVNKNNVNVNTDLNKDNNDIERTVDVLVHDTPNGDPRFFEAVTSSPEHNWNLPPPPGFIVSPYQVPRFHNGGNVEDLLGDVQSTQAMYLQQNSVFMCNTRKITHQCCCCNQERSNNNQSQDNKKNYVTEKNIEITYDYPKSTQVMIPLPPTTPHQGTTTEEARTIVFVERRIPVKPKKFDFFFRSRSAPVGENEEPIYATVNKLPKRLKRMELANLEQEVAYKTSDKPSVTSLKTDPKTDSEASQAGIQPDDDTSPSEREKSVAPARPEITKAKKRKKFSLTFKKRERKRRENKLETPVSPVVKNGAMKNGKGHVIESDSEQLILGTECLNGQSKLCDRHRGRNTVSSSSSGPRYKRDSYQDITTSHSEHERTNSVCSSVNSSATSACTHKSRKFSAPPHDGSIPWCGCWGAGCI